MRRYPVPAAAGVSIDRDAEVILVRWQNAVYAFALSCPHQNVAVRWLDADHRFQCPKHKSKYQPDGAYVEGRATRNLDRYTITREAEQVAVDLGALHKSDADAAGWAVAVVRTGTSSVLALSRVCPHQGTTVNVVSSGFYCPNHGAQFNATGTWTGGQRTSNLTSYATSYDADTGVLTIG